MADNLEVVDSGGRKLKFKEMDPADMLDLYEAAGDQSGNRAWLLTAMIAASLLEVDGIPAPACRTKEDVKRVARLLGNAGMVAGNKLLFGDDNKPDAAASEKEAAKN